MFLGNISNSSLFYPQYRCQPLPQAHAHAHVCPTHDDVIKWKHFHVTGPLLGESTAHMWIPLTKASDAELWCFLWYVPEQTV